MPKQLPVCVFCGHTRFSLGFAKQMSCMNCGKIMAADNIGPSMRKISDRQEKKNARAFGARRTISSGSTPFDKGDVKIRGELRMECKSTESASYGLKRAELEQLASQAKDDEIPVFVIEFRGDRPTEYAVIPKDWLLQLFNNRK